MDSKPVPTRRADYPHFTPMPTRWGDNDAYGHVNNAVYFQYFDSAVNQHLIEHGVLDVLRNEVIGLVLETGCRYFSSVAFPDRVTVGMKVAHLGNSSVRYEIALFRNDEDAASAIGHFVHVYVDRPTQKPVPIPARVRELLAALAPA